ncbi:hypothetical protein GPECTOR_436g316 [Gonium pectorale]|uniref:Uncharacterized protein n=1 Tax=Gonium pectorale TaxID=33097 RepID=A0A150FV62_GONPE|nr:hypothetical protein GPECTOR_436g316 [Gonium pectorale]|eukprot:KXZ41489.1 hypothetical protein GPECTOR_436g316 [Gonium pectorale]
MMTILNGQLAKVATKDDLANLESNMSSKISKLEADISKLPTKEDLQKGPDWYEGLGRERCTSPSRGAPDVV